MWGSFVVGEVGEERTMPGIAQEKAPGQGKKHFTEFITSCATKPVQIANAPTVRLFHLLMMKTEQNTKCLHPQPSPC